MRAFDVHLNEKKLCTSGIGGDGILTAIVTWVTGQKGNDCFLHVGSLISPTKEHVSWVDHEPLKTGDRVQLTVLETNKVDEPMRKNPENREKDLEDRKNYVRRMVNELGWKIQESPTKGKSAEIAEIG